MNFPRTTRKVYSDPTEFAYSPETALYQLYINRDDWADQGLVNGDFFLAWKVALLQMFAQSEEAPVCSLDSLLYFQTHVNRCQTTFKMHNRRVANTLLLPIHITKKKFGSILTASSISTG
jgi:hypothetical protein